MTRRIKAKRIENFETTVFTVWTQRARETGALNLGQGYPDFDPPEFVLEAAREAMKGFHQYAPLAGMPVLLEAIAKRVSAEWGRAIDPEAEVTVTNGATEGLYASFQALVDPGDEVILIEPFYDSYPPAIAMAGGVPRYVPLRPSAAGTWALDFDELRGLLSLRSRMLVLNTPHNPTGKVFSLEELEELAAIAIEHELLVVTDEVYDKMVFDGLEHHPIGSLPGMWERTVTLYSAAKTFGVTGWKVGWAIAAAELSHAIRMAHQWIPFSVASPLQNALAAILTQCETSNYYQELRRSYQKKRDRFLPILREVGLRPLIPHGTYFVIADTSEWGLENDEAFCHHLLKEHGVVAIPPSYFYEPAHQHLARHHVRFAFCKRDEVFEVAAECLRK